MRQGRLFCLQVFRTLGRLRLEGGEGVRLFLGPSVMAGGALRTWQEADTANRLCLLPCPPWFGLILPPGVKVRQTAL